jgi:hypothetical protein
MACCGQGRAGLAPTRAVTLHLPPADPPALAPAPADVPRAVARGLSSVRIRYTRQVPVRVSGPASGRGYEFSGSAPVQSVDARDAEGLVGTGLFRRIY